MRVAEDGPVGLKVSSAEVDLGDGEEDGDEEDDDVCHCVEEGKLAGQASNDDHSPARSHDGE